MTHRDLDALIAEKIFRWERDGDFLIPPVGTPMRDPHWTPTWDTNGLPCWRPRYSTDIAAAWHVVEKLELHIHPCGLKWFATPYDTVGDWPVILADTAPLAICFAALKAVGVELADTVSEVSA